jgi:diacylglycerol kinase (ATP)
MANNNRFSLRKRAGSFSYAFQGISNFFRTQHNAWIHLFFTAVVFAAAFYFHVSRMEILVLVVVTGLVWAAEIFNTAIEAIMDHLSPDQHPSVKVIKDLAAAAVLLSALTAVIAGLIIFIPKIF